MQVETYIHDSKLGLEFGGSLEKVEIAYSTYGRLNESKDNVVWVCHALTANSAAADWWPGMIGPEAYIDTNKYFVVCANILGSCYGTTGPLSNNPATNQPYYHDFPLITLNDIVACHELLFNHLQLTNITLGIGGSMGGNQILRWANKSPTIFEKLVLLTTSGKESVWRKAIHTTQRMAIENTPNWNLNVADAGLDGLKLARAIGMLTYRSSEILNTQQEDEVHKLDNFKVSSYLKHQGDKLAQRFNAYSYWYLTKALDTYDLCRDSGKSLEVVLSEIMVDTIVIGISSDILCPLVEQRHLAIYLGNAKLEIIDSPFGHEGFLVEVDRIGDLVQSFCSSVSVEVKS